MSVVIEKWKKYILKKKTRNRGDHSQLDKIMKVINYSSNSIKNNASNPSHIYNLFDTLTKWRK